MINDSKFAVTDYENLVRAVAKKIEISIWSSGPIESVTCQIEMQYQDVYVALNDYFKSGQVCESENNMVKISIRDKALKQLQSEIELAKQT